MGVSLFALDYGTNVYKANNNYTTAHDAAEGLVATSALAYSENSKISNSYTIRRGLALFDTSPLVNGLTITSARYAFVASTTPNPSYRGTETDNGHSDFYITEGVFSNPAVIADYGNQLTYTTSGGSITYDDIIADSDFYHAITLNAAGEGWIDDAGDTKLCLRVKGDIDGSQPTGENVINAGQGGSLYAPITYPATLVTSATAQLNGQYNGLVGGPPFLEVTHNQANPTYPRVFFQYGLTTGYGTDTATQNGLTIWSLYNASISGLSADTLYHFRTALESSNGVYRYGVDKTFITSDSQWVSLF